MLTAMICGGIYGIIASDGVEEEGAPSTSWKTAAEAASEEGTVTEEKSEEAMEGTELVVENAGAKTDGYKGTEGL